MDVRSRIWTIIVFLVLDTYVISACNPAAIVVGAIVGGIILAGHDNCGPCKYNINF